MLICRDCPSVAANAATGIAMFLVNVLLTLYTVWAAFTDDYSSFSDDHVSTGDLLQVFIRHLQHFIIITRLNIE